jgi:outer membrane protein TolC
MIRSPIPSASFTTLALICAIACVCHSIPVLADGPVGQVGSSTVTRSKKLAALPLPSQANNSQEGANQTTGGQLNGGTSAENPAPPIAPPRVPDVIELPKPELKALITIDEQMDPYELEASSARNISLRQALVTAVEQNLDIGISATRVQEQKWTYLGSLGKFLPAATGGYYNGYARGVLNFPLFGAAGNTMGAVQTPTSTTINSAFNAITGGLRYDLYQGGRVVFGALQNRNLLRAERAGAKATLSDTLFRVTQNYYNLMLSEALLQIRIRAVETSTEQLRINSDLEANGLATNLDVLQSRTQLSRDRQDQITQQVSRRTASITLADTLNQPLGEDLAPAERLLRKVRLVSTDLKIGDLLRIAVDNRPELKQYEELRRAARKAIMVAAAPLQPTAALNGNIISLGTHMSHMDQILVGYLGVNWKLNGLGTTDLANVETSRYVARQRLLEANRELVTVFDQVRSSLLRSLQAEKNIIETTDEVASAIEELRLARLRFENGLGTNIDIINAQRDLTTALIDRAQAIINFNVAQAQLLHDIGLTTVENLTSTSPLRG